MKAIKTFFYSGDDFQPPYFWMTLFELLGVIAFIMKLCGSSLISDTLLGILWGNVLIWAGVYNWNKVKNGVKHEKDTTDN